MPVFGLPAIFEDGYRDVNDKPIVALGSCFVSNVDDVLISYVRFSEDVEEGDAVRIKYDHYTKTNLSPETSGGSDFPAAGSQKISEHDATYLTSLSGFPEEPTLRDYAMIRIIGGTGEGQEGYITHYTNKVLNIRWYDTDDGTLKTALDATSDYTIWAPWYVERAYSDAINATEGTVSGIVLARTAKKDQYGFVGVEGDFRVQVYTAVDAGDILIPSPFHRGEGERPAAADVIPPYATVHTAGAADSLVRATVYARKISIVEEIAESQIRGFPRPEAV